MRTHLLALAQTHGLPASRVDEVLAMVGLGGVAGRRAGGFSLGMAAAPAAGGLVLWRRDP